MSTLSLHDALPIYSIRVLQGCGDMFMLDLPLIFLAFTHHTFTVTRGLLQNSFSAVWQLEGSHEAVFSSVSLTPSEDIWCERRQSMPSVMIKRSCRPASKAVSDGD